MTAIVTDVKYRMSPAVIRELGEAGVRVVACHRGGADGDPPLGFYSKYTAERHTFPTAGFEEMLYSLCKDIAVKEGRRPALLPVGAATLSMLSRPETAERFSGVCGFCIPSREQLALLNDKESVAELARSVGVPVPRSYAPSDGEDIDDFAARVPLPCAVKPKNGEKLGLTASKRYRIARTSEELREGFEHFSKLAGEVPLVLEYLPGVGVACSVLARDGEIISSVCHRRVREYPVSGGPSTCCDAVSYPALTEYAERLTQAVGLNGPAMFEFKEDMNGEPRLLEVNPRIWGSYPLTRAAKTGFTFAWFAESFNIANPDSPVSRPPREDFRPRRMVFFPSDFAAALGYAKKGNIKAVIGSFVDFLRPNVKDGLFEWSDARPAFRYYRSLLKRDDTARAGGGASIKPAESAALNQSRLCVDLHVHTTLSNDGRSSKEKLAKAAAKRGLDAIVLTDHNAYAIDRPEKIGGVWLLPGCEYSTDKGHILGLFPAKPPAFPPMRGGKRFDAQEVLQALRECGAVTVLAHPYLRESDNPDAPVDCIETANARVYFKNGKALKQAEALAGTLRLPMTGGSDAHSSAEVGGAYTVIDAKDCSLPALREALLNGRCRPVLVRNTPRRCKGLSQFRQALRSRSPGRIVKGIAYILYCILLDIVKTIE